jgi:hypothetical protein|uniref:Uncharacterized protein n=1 Tax=Zea mays TaxID=4577 RepID=C0PAA0_MAIZE|nr:unknown [Zea mays]
MYGVKIEQGARDVEAYADDDAKIVVRLAGDIADTMGSTAGMGGGMRRRRRVKRGSGDGPVGEDDNNLGRTYAQSKMESLKP